MYGTQVKHIVVALASLVPAVPAFAQSIPPGLAGSWDVSVEECAASGTSVTQIDISSDRIETFGGNAIIREVEQIGDITFVAGDFQQLEGAAEVEPRTRTYFRFDRRGGPDRMTFVWKDVQATDLVRCDTSLSTDDDAASTPEDTSSTTPEYDGQLPIPLGLWVIAGGSCETPANAAWRVYDGAGLRGASSVRCEIDAIERQGDSILFSQLCTRAYDDKVDATRDRITITAPSRFILVEGEESSGQDFNWCGPQLHP
ncbi:hypothetical protein [Sulfitobacter pontiacus]|uniref:hypothetical protein n=1 Tax=Sulfitobacter pontiacus TaxID=60137 RepID=UPI0027449FBF|nr:hypothetical protein [Sulfitobacter pontiacus]GLO79892.1 hypothetical protein MACH23_33130 [Sulfitobacter pontiacus]